MTGNLRGAALMTLSMLAFAIEDVLIKTLGARIPAGQIVAIISGTSAVIFALWLLAKREPLFVKEHLDRGVWLRGFFEVMGTMLFISALIRLDVTLLSAIIQATPLVVALGGVLFLGQTVGWQRWSAISVGLLGVLLIIRPWDALAAASGDASWAILLGIGGMIGLAGRDLSTRALQVDISAVHLTFHAFLLLVPAGLALTYLNGETLTPLTRPETLTFVLCVAVVLLAYLCIVAATRTGDAAFISMFRYTRMVFALILGMAILGERPDTFTLLGAAIVISAGVFTFIREARAARTSKR